MTPEQTTTALSPILPSIDDTAGFAADYYLKIEGTKGEHSRNWDILSFSWGLSQGGSAGRGGR